MEWNKENRAQYFNSKLSEKDYPGWGRAQRISDELGVSHSQASNWLTGALPREHGEIKRVADFLGLNIMHWVYGVSTSNLNKRKLMDSIAFAKTVEDQYQNETMSPEDFAEVVMFTYEDKIKGAAVLESLAVIRDITSRGGSDKNGTNGE